jgi:signal transduction histidine kinase
MNQLFINITGHSASRLVSVLTLMIVGGALAITLGLGFLTTVKRMETDTLHSLEILVNTRARYESSYFQQAERNVADLKRALSARIDQYSDANAEQKFRELFHLHVDGIWRTRSDSTDFSVSPSMYLHDVELTSSLYRRAIASYELLEQRGPALVPPYYSVYMDFVEKGLVVYAPGMDWGSRATPLTDNHNYPTMQGASPRNNPAREKFWTPVYFDEEADLWMVSVVEPFDIEEQWLGTVGHDVSLTELINATRNEQIPDSYFLLLDGDGKLITHPGISADSNSAVRFTSDSPLPTEQLHELGALLIDSNALLGTINYAGKNYLYAYNTIVGPDWKLVSIYPEESITHRALQALIAPLGFGLVILVLALYLANLAFRSLVGQPLKLIDDAVTEFGETNTIRKIPIRSNNEFGRLARSFESISTNLKYREASLLSARKDWERTFNTVTEMICILDRKLEIQRCNQSFADSYQTRADILVHQSRLTLIPKANHQTFKEALELTTLTKKPQSFTAKLKYPEGVFEVTYSPLLNNKNKLIGVVEVTRDVTAHSKLEAQLLQSQKMEAIGHLAGGIAHDFNNLLQVIIGYSEVLIRKSVSSGLERDAGQVYEAAQRAASLTQQLLTFSRQEEMTSELIDLNDLLADTVKLVKRLIEEHIQFEYQLFDKPLLVDANRVRLEQVIINLCVNARDAMPDGGKLTLALSERTVDVREMKSLGLSKPGRYTSLEVSDTGIGMDSYTLSHIFEPFFTTKSKEEGTGLGLATAYGIILQHGGSIDVSSKLEDGTRFQVLLPYDDSKTEAEPAAAEPEDLNGSECILLAEDDSGIRDLVAEFLSSSGYEVITAEDGVRAVELFKENQQKVDLLLFDVIMPRMNGRTAADEIHELAPNLPCLFASGYSEDFLHDGYHLKQDVHLIKKPFNRANLLSRVRELLTLNIPATQAS